MHQSIRLLNAFIYQIFQERLQLIGWKLWWRQLGAGQTIKQIADALIALGTDRHHRDTQALCQGRGIDNHAQAKGFIAHIEGKYCWQIQGQPLQQQLELSHNLTGINNHYRQIKMDLVQKIFHHGIISAMAIQVVNAR